MSGHLIGCAGALTGLGKSHKLALLAFADSADDRTHIAFPGYAGVQTWADCSRSRAAELISGLVAAGYLKLHKTARPGRRAEYVVFPNGCCDLHRAPIDDDTTLDVAALATAAGVPVETARALLAAMQTPTAAPNGSEFSDSSSGDGSEFSDSSAGVDGDGSGNGSEESDSSAQRVQNASETSDPSTTGTTTPPSPRTAGGDRCAKPGPIPHANCRGCGTTNRQLAQQAKRDTADQRRQSTQQQLREQRDREAAERRPADAVRSLLDQTRRTLSTSRSNR